MYKFFGALPFRKKFPELGETIRLRIPESISPHLEMVMEHLDRQCFRWGPDYVTAFFHQCDQAMLELEAADCRDMVASAGITPHRPYPSSAQPRTLRHFRSDDADAYNEAVLSSFHQLRAEHGSGSRGTWRRLEQQLKKRKISASDIDTFYEICHGFYSVQTSDLETLRIRFSGTCPLIESLWDFSACREHEPLAELRQRFAEINNLKPTIGSRVQSPVSD